MAANWPSEEAFLQGYTSDMDTAKDALPQTQAVNALVTPTLEQCLTLLSKEDLLVDDNAVFGLQ